MKKIVIKSFLTSLTACAALMMLMFVLVTGYALLTTQTLSVFDLYTAEVSEDGLFMRVSTKIWFVIILTVTFLTILGAAFKLLLPQSLNKNGL
ncbi:hypothetical protein FZC84_19400 [Rossellomorea vietnamensis]|uniref:Uncharacterized protein n=1 Tax=Rossellomorea vietnamensis TaxID=218284 RepID=A0A5D4M629_9BACI|nr:MULTISPECIES: hypothetical protein [Bacillaceae]TYR97399.1 hypothetical protein FZC84_19400 [Rossellomorea vietnamensis]